MILITVVVGNLGSSVIALLIKKVAQGRLVVTSSDADGLEKLKAIGFEARLPNFSEAKSLKETFNESVNHC